VIKRYSTSVTWYTYLDPSLDPHQRRRAPPLLQYPHSVPLSEYHDSMIAPRLSVPVGSAFSPDSSKAKEFCYIVAVVEEVHTLVVAWILPDDNIWSCKR